MRIKVSERKIKARLTSLAIVSSIFLGTIIVCVVIFFALISSGIKILSPITTRGETQSMDAQILMVQAICKEKNIPCKTVTPIDSKTIQILLDTHATVFLSPKKDLNKQLSSLQEALSQLTIKGKQFKKLDFRFDNVIVSF